MRYEINPDNTIDIFVINENFFLFPDNIGNLPDYIQFNTVHGSIDCSKCNLTTLKGMPRIVTVDFKCHNNHLTSLDYAPESIGGSFTCDKNKITKEMIIEYIKKINFSGYLDSDFEINYKTDL
jgi:hypothetical protein